MKLLLFTVLALPLFANLRTAAVATENLEPSDLQAHQQRGEEAEPKIPDAPPEPPRTDIHISGIYPHLTVYGIYSQNGAHYMGGHNECGIGAIVPWADKLWMVNYAPHQPNGSEHKLYSINADLSQQMTVHPESVGGTPAGRMIHKESNQLLIAHYLIDAEGKIRVISPKDMPMRVTAIARHLTDPANMVYYIDMEGAIWEANVHTLAVKRLFKKPVPGWHGKGGYTSQGRLVISNNGELHVGNYEDVLVGGKATNQEERGVLAEWNGKQWKIIERRQYTEVTGPQGITGGSDGDDPIWTMGWDRRSVRLKVLDNGTWHTFLLPKASYCNDASHGWYTEWPRIREITDGRWMMDMHGMFFDFPKTFSGKNSAGIKPISSHLRYIPDFCEWNGKLVLASDETSIQGNPLAGQPQTNLWFGDYEDLKTLGPTSGYGGPWIEDEVTANTPSDPFLIAGFDRRVLHLATGRTTSEPEHALRTTDKHKITSMPEKLAHLPRVTIDRGDWKQPAPGFSFEVSKPVTVYLAVDRRGDPKLPSTWKLTDMTLEWLDTYQDQIYSREFPAGKIPIPGNSIEHIKGSFGMPHLVFIQANESAELEVKPIGTANVFIPPKSKLTPGDDSPVLFTIQIDKDGDGQWTDHQTVEVPANGYIATILPENLDANWLRLKTDRDCVATAFLHQTASNFANGELADNKKMFAGLADADIKSVRGALLYPAKRNRNLRVIADDDRFFEFSKAKFEFNADESDERLIALLQVEPEFSVDEASVIVKHRGKNFRLPKGDAVYDKPFAFGWPRDIREVESERHLANIHGTFYELPLLTNGAPPQFPLMRPVASHFKQITDFCTWNGLLVLTGVRADADNDGHIFSDSDQQTALWFGGIDDLWKLGKPVGRGGPWKETPVKAGQKSDPYLMKGYDRKSLQLSHASTSPVTFHLEVDITGEGLWHRYKSINVDARQKFVYTFPDAFQAAWVRLVSDEDTTATGQFTYE